MAGELEGYFRSVSHVKPTFVVAERTVFALKRTVYSGKPAVVKELLYKPTQRVLKQGVAQQLSVPTGEVALHTL